MPRRTTQLSLRLRWVLAVVLFASIAATAYIVAHAGGSGASSAASVRAAIETNEEGQIAVSEDQAPRHAALRRGLSPEVAITRAVTADVRVRIATGQLTGPLGMLSCSPAGRGRPGRDPFVCSVTSAGIGYTFYGVADLRARTLTWCKQDAVDVPGLSVPLSPSCLS